jgi:hypothetical protein
MKEYVFLYLNKKNQITKNTYNYAENSKINLYITLNIKQKNLKFNQSRPLSYPKHKIFFDAVLKDYEFLAS